MQGDLRIGRWLIRPRLNAIVCGEHDVRVEPKVMEVLVRLARQPGEVVSREDLIKDVWGNTSVTEAALTRCIAELRKVFDDDVKEPRVIETIAKRGYRLVAPVASHSGPLARRRWLWATAVGLLLPAILIVAWIYRIKSSSARSDGVTRLSVLLEDGLYGTSWAVAIRPRGH